ncbi:MAG: uncharacterized protein PWQ12_1781 [Clostridiales bacterium]|jgi:environmental stress-induced protein Ves|nr:uncharacterized protein [Clostridiales bacterium]
MDIQMIEPARQNVSSWAHGESTELYLFPESGSFEARKFLWRVSTATVASDQSTFSVLYGVKRWLMPIDGPLLLKHMHNQQSLYEINLKPFEAHCFRGDWETLGFGMTRDFNLLLKAGAYGMIKHVSMYSKEMKTLGEVFPEAFDERLPLLDRRLTVGIYALDGELSVQSAEAEWTCPVQGLFMMHYKLEELEQVKAIRIRQEGNPILFVVSY